MTLIPFVYSPHKIFPVKASDAYVYAERLHASRAPDEGPFFVVSATDVAHAREKGEAMYLKMVKVLDLLISMDADHRLISLIQSPTGPVVADLLDDPHFIHKLNCLMVYIR